MEFEDYVCGDKDNLDDGVSKAAVALLGDVASTLPSAAPFFQQRSLIQSFIQVLLAIRGAGLLLLLDLDWDCVGAGLHKTAVVRMICTSLFLAQQRRCRRT